MTTFNRFEWQNAWIDDPRVHDELISVLAVLLRYINFDGTCHPSQVTIAEHLKRSISTVRRRLTLIEDIGYLARINRTGTSTVYMAQIPATPVTGAPPAPVQPLAPVTTTPVTGAPCTHDTPVTRDTPPPSPVHATPVTGAPLTVFEQSKEQFRSSSCANDSEVLENPETENQPPQQPAEILSELCQSADITVTVFQAESLWAQVRSQLIDHDEQDVWDYFRWKLSDLQGTEYPVRAKLKFLNADVPRWLDIQRKRNVGRNDHAQPEFVQLAQTEVEPTPVAEIVLDATSENLGRAAWSAALPTLKASVSQHNYTEWLAPLTPIGIEHGTLHIDAHDGFKAVYVDDTYRKLILDSLAAAGADVAELKFHPEFSI